MNEQFKKLLFEKDGKFLGTHLDGTLFFFSLFFKLSQFESQFSNVYPRHVRFDECVHM